MDKKIIALACVMLLLVSCFVACGKKPTIKGKNGMEYVMVTDEEGNSVVNEDGDIAVYVTDAKGKYVTDANGERQTNYIDFPDYIVHENPSVENGYILETPDYRMSYPAGWTVNNIGRATPTEVNKAYVEIINYGELDEGETLETYFAQNNEAVKEVEAMLKDAYSDITYTTTDQKVTAQQYDAKMGEFTVRDDNGEVFYFSQVIYFMHNDQIFKVTYICNEGYDSSIDVLSMINEGLVMKGSK